MAVYFLASLRLTYAVPTNNRRHFLKSTLRGSLVLLAFFCAVPLFAAVAADVTLPVVGYLELPNNLTYRTELTVTNHRDVLQYIELAFIVEGHAGPMAIFPLQPRETKFLPHGGFATSSGGQVGLVGAMRIRALQGFEGAPDPMGRIEGNAFIVADRGRHGSSRQEVAGIPSEEYEAEEAVFLGVRHSLGTGVYTNVGIVNMHPTQTETFYVQFQYQAEPVPVVVPPLSHRQIRIPGEGSGGRWVRVYPEWSLGDGQPLRRTPWVAYASSVDIGTGDAFSGMRVPATSKFVF